MTELAADIAKQNQGTDWCDSIFWNDLLASIRSGYFDADRPIYLLQEGKRQLISDEINELIGSEHVDAETSEILNPLIQSCWASVKTLADWSLSRRYDIPILWAAVVDPAQGLPPEVLSRKPMLVDRGKLAATIESLRKIKPRSGLSQPQILELINADLPDGVTTSLSTLKTAQKRLKSFDQV